MKNKKSHSHWSERKTNHLKIFFLLQDAVKIIIYWKKILKKKKKLIIGINSRKMYVFSL